MPLPLNRTAVVFVDVALVLEEVKVFAAIVEVLEYDVAVDALFL